MAFALGRNKDDDPNGDETGKSAIDDKGYPMNVCVQCKNKRSVIHIHRCDCCELYYCEHFIYVMDGGRTVCGGCDPEYHSESMLEDSDNKALDHEQDMYGVGRTDLPAGMRGED